MSEYTAMGKRLRWVRTKLGISQQSLCDRSGMLRPNYTKIENGRRTKLYEELYSIARILDGEWQRKYSKNFPMHEKETLPEITLVWIMLGRDPYLKTLNCKISIISEDFRRREMELIERNFDLESKLKRGKRD